MYGLCMLTVVPIVIHSIWCIPVSVCIVYMRLTMQYYFQIYGDGRIAKANEDDREGERRRSRKTFIFGVQLCMDFIVKFQDQAPIMYPIRMSAYTGNSTINIIIKE